MFRTNWVTEITFNIDGSKSTCREGTEEALDKIARDTISTPHGTYQTL